MTRTIVHRGPDGEGHLVGENVGIGMRRLSIIDLEGGGQPIANETGDIHVVQNGEIYNYRELRLDLTRRGHRFRTDSDTEVIVHAYEEWGGLDFAKRLRGMFAIAVWDRTRQQLWLARDRVGIKPLLYAQGSKGFAFASELKALLAGPVLDAALDPMAISDYLTFGSADLDRSFIAGVRQLPPGCVLRLGTQSGQSTVHRYWRLEVPEEPIRIDEQAAEQALLDKLRESVRLHLVADVPVGALLSGGIDSSAVVGMMAQAGVSDLKTFSIGFDHDDFNELPYARQVAEKWSTDHHEHVVTADAVQMVEQIASHLDEPFADASAIPTWFVAELASRHLKVVLTGDGGDELFGGYDRFAVASRMQYLDRVPQALRDAGAGLGRMLPDASPGKYFLGYAALDAAGRYASEHCLFPMPLQERLLLPEYSPSQLGVEHAFFRSMEAFRQLQTRDYVSDCMRFDTARYLPMDILVKVDRMTMAHGLEARPPMLDHEFLEFAAQLPTPLKYRSAKSRKYLLRKAVDHLLPPAIRERKKAGFSVPLASWFSGPLRAMFEDMVMQNGRVSAYLDPSVIRMLMVQNERGRRDHGLRLWAILILELWLRRLGSA